MRDPQTITLLESIGANLRRLRRREGLTQEALAERAGMEVRFAQRVERGKIDIAVSTLNRLAMTLGVSPAALLRPAKLEPAKPGRPPSGPAPRRPSSGRTER